MPEKIKCEVVVIIQSCQKFGSRRAACKQTWLKHVPPGVEYFFGVGDNKIKEESQNTWEWDTILFKTDDGYTALPEKTWLMMRYALSHYDFKYLFKCDDDTYVVLDRLLELLFAQKGGVFISSVQWSGDDLTISGGAGYALSRDYVEIALEEFWNIDKKIADRHQEDMYVQYALRRRDILPVDTMLFNRVAYKKMPGRYNDTITAHILHDREMEAIDAGLYAPTAKHGMYLYYDEFTQPPLPYITFIPETRTYFMADDSKNFGTYSYNAFTKKLKLKPDADVTQIVLKYTGNGYWEEENLGPLAIISPITPEELEGKQLQTAAESDRVTA